MFHNRLNEKQFAPMMIVALLAPITQTATECSWLTVLTVGGICLLTCWGLSQANPDTNPGRWLAVVQGLWTCVILSQLLHWSMYCWPDYDSYYVIPLTILALSAWAAWGGTEQTTRTGCVLLWPLCIMLGVVLLSSLREIRGDYLRPGWKMKDADIITVLLIPTLGGYLSNEKKKPSMYAVLLGTALLASTAAFGVLSGKAVVQAESPLYEMSRSLSLFGFAKRFESVVAAAVTLGYFITASFLISVLANISESLKTDWGRKGILSGMLITGAIFISGVKLKSRITAIGSILIFVLIPVMIILIKYAKNRKLTLDK